jgi:uncharacterized membrane protein
MAIIVLMQAIPDELAKMAERFDVWKEKKAAEKDRGVRGDGYGSRGGFRGGGGGRRDRGKW